MGIRAELLVGSFYNFDMLVDEQDQSKWGGGEGGREA